MARGAPARVRVSEAEELLSLAVEAARMAGDLLSARVGRGAEHDVRAKSTPTDLVSEADVSSERASCSPRGAPRTASWARRGATRERGTVG